jgi:hypothetical protein
MELQMNIILSTTILLLTFLSGNLSYAEGSAGVETTEIDTPAVNLKNTIEKSKLEEGHDWELVFTIPAIKLKEGEDAQLFQGIGFGLQFKNMFDGIWKKNSLGNSLILTPLGMLSTEKILEADGENSSSYVLSAGFIIGIQSKKNNSSIGIGYTYDVLGTKSIKNTQRNAILLNISQSL